MLMLSAAPTIDRAGEATKEEVGASARARSPTQSAVPHSHVIGIAQLIGLAIKPSNSAQIATIDCTWQCNSKHGINQFPLPIGTSLATVPLGEKGPTNRSFLRIVWRLTSGE